MIPSCTKNKKKKKLRTETELSGTENFKFQLKN